MRRASSSSGASPSPSAQSPLKKTKDGEAPRGILSLLGRAEGKNDERDHNKELLVEGAAHASFGAMPLPPSRQPRGPPACIWGTKDYAGPCARVREPGHRPARRGCSETKFYSAF
jgi:hypothetical protein